MQTLRILITTMALLPAFWAAAFVVDAAPGKVGFALSDLPEGETSVEVHGQIDVRDLISLATNEAIESLDLSEAAIVQLSTAKPVFLNRSFFAAGEVAPYCMFSTTIKEIVLPKDVISIGEGAFANSSLKSIAIPAKVVNISDFAFQDCKELGSVSGCNAVESIGDRAFAGCSALTSADFAGSKLHTVGTEAFAGCISLTSLSLPSSVKSVSSNAFAQTALENLTLTQLKNAGDYAFANMGNLTEITLAQADATGAFLFDPALQSASEVPANIPDYYFAGCTALDGASLFIDAESLGAFSLAEVQTPYITFGEGLSSVGTDAFSGITDLNYIDVKALEDAIPNVEMYSFRGLKQNEVELVVAAEHISLWKSHSLWGKFKVVDEPTNSVGTIENLSGIAIAVRHGIATITSDEPLRHVLLTDLSGKTLVSLAPEATEATLELPTGVSVLSAKTDSQSRTIKLIITR